MRPTGQHGEDQRLGVRPDVACLAVQALRRPFGIAPVRARHVLRQGAVPRSAVAPRMGGDAFAAVEHLDRARRGAGVHLLADQRVRHRVEEALDLDVIVDADAGEMPLGILVVVLAAAPA